MAVASKVWVLTIVYANPNVAVRRSLSAIRNYLKGPMLVMEDFNKIVNGLEKRVYSPLDMTQVRPISLCNTTYRIISKIIVQRHRDIMPSLVSLNQVAFVPRRQIQDNIVISQEVFLKFRTMKGRRGHITWKIDPAKDYDKLQWSFIKSVLVEIGIDEKLIELIMWCITSVRCPVILNGELT
ncbi:hypothetical protein Ddye_026777 [Dipteronia dyeriana]|uniref:Reverse transcriptase domain-containing protein n=1 Tax=Dipteronia dyeriana TaxID=168575 RepID=A0AAD9TNC8_9ROSI|nr:hypothetical protein Ddye_026777 [Dipteronia dyeriana]